MTPVVDIDQVTLKRGSHKDFADGVCIMELAAYIADEPFSDRPACVSPVLGAFLRSWNDTLDDEQRQKLKPYAARSLNTAGDRDADERRAWLATDWLVRVCAPAFLDLAGLTEDAAALRQLAPLDGTSAARLAKPTLSASRKNAAAARVAAWAAAGDAAWVAAGDAAWAAARAAAGDAAGAAAWAAARAAAWAAAGAAAGAAARAVLKPTVDELQVSAWVLLDRMVEA